MNATLLFVIFVIVMLALAILPWVHRMWTTGRGITRDDQAEIPLPTTQESSRDDRGFRDEPVEEADHDVLPPPTVASMQEKLTKARGLISERLAGIRSGSIDVSTWEKLEELLILADVGIDATMDTVDRLRATLSASEASEGPQLLEALKDQMKSDLATDRQLVHIAQNGKIPVWLFVGVNGVGKTTSIGKTGRRLGDQGLNVLMAAGDTFRAAAAEQLATWADRCGADFVRGSEGADPSSVIYDAVQAAASRDMDVVLADTAGRLHNKVNLMEELAKVRRVADRDPGQVAEVLLVIDATTGQNGLSQAREFANTVAVTGVVLTKLDGSAKGGIVFAIERELGIPVKLVGLGEGERDLIDFDPSSFVEALFGDE